MILNTVHNFKNNLQWIQKEAALHACIFGPWWSNFGRSRMCPPFDISHASRNVDSGPPPLVRWKGDYACS